MCRPYLKINYNLSRLTVSFARMYELLVHILKLILFICIIFTLQLIVLAVAAEAAVRGMDSYSSMIVKLGSTSPVPGNNMGISYGNGSVALSFSGDDRVVQKMISHDHTAPIPHVVPLQRFQPTNFAESRSFTNVISQPATISQHNAAPVPQAASIPIFSRTFTNVMSQPATISQHNAATVPQTVSVQMYLSADAPVPHPYSNSVHQPLPVSQNYPIHLQKSQPIAVIQNFAVPVSTQVPRPPPTPHPHSNNIHRSLPSTQSIPVPVQESPVEMTQYHAVPQSVQVSQAVPNSQSYAVPVPVHLSQPESAPVTKPTTVLMVVPYPLTEYQSTKTDSPALYALQYVNSATNTQSMHAQRMHSMKQHFVQPNDEIMYIYNLNFGHSNQIMRKQS